MHPGDFVLDAVLVLARPRPCRHRAGDLARRARQSVRADVRHYVPRELSARGASRYASRRRHRGALRRGPAAGRISRRETRLAVARLSLRPHARDARSTGAQAARCIPPTASRCATPTRRPAGTPSRPSRCSSSGCRRIIRRPDLSQHRKRRSSARSKEPGASTPATPSSTSRRTTSSSCRAGSRTASRPTPNACCSLIPIVHAQETLGLWREEDPSNSTQRQ